jgi:hypothetical protein
MDGAPLVKYDEWVGLADEIAMKAKALKTAANDMNVAAEAVKVLRDEGRLWACVFWGKNNKKARSGDIVLWDGRGDVWGRPRHLMTLPIEEVTGTGKGIAGPSEWSNHSSEGELEAARKWYEWSRQTMLMYLEMYFDTSGEAVPGDDPDHADIRKADRIAARRAKKILNLTDGDIAKLFAEWQSKLPENHPQRKWLCPTL